MTNPSPTPKPAAPRAVARITQSAINAVRASTPPRATRSPNFLVSLDHPNHEAMAALLQQVVAGSADASAVAQQVLDLLNSDGITLSVAVDRYVNGKVEPMTLPTYNAQGVVVGSEPAVFSPSYAIYSRRPLQVGDAHPETGQPATAAECSTYNAGRMITRSWGDPVPGQPGRMTNVGLRDTYVALASAAYRESVGFVRPAGQYSQPELRKMGVNVQTSAPGTPGAPAFPGIPEGRQPRSGPAPTGGDTVVDPSDAPF